MSIDPRLENYNYWRDSRTIAGMVSKPKFEETDRGIYLLWTTEDDEGIEIVHKLTTRWEVCPTCRGNGTHVNASIDCCGLTREDFDRDPGFEEDYRSGVYNVTCNECAGLRVVPVVCETDPLAEAYNKHREAEYNDARESAQERAMGA